MIDIIINNVFHEMKLDFLPKESKDNLRKLAKFYLVDLFVDIRSSEENVYIKEIKKELCNWFTETKAFGITHDYTWRIIMKIMEILKIDHGSLEEYDNKNNEIKME